MSNIVAFYLIGQFAEGWAEDFYIPQMELLKSSGLYDQLEFIDIHVSGGKQPLPFIPDKIREISYHSTKAEEENETFKRVWDFAKANPGYKILFFHSDGATHKGEMKIRKRAWRNFMEFCTIEMWDKCISLLDFYDCVGADYIHQAVYSGGEHVVRGPHYPGMFWWANSNYIRKLDPTYFDQKVPWKRYLGELWIGSGDPREYSIQRTNINCYYTEIQIDKKFLLDKTVAHIAEIKSPKRYLDE